MMMEFYSPSASCSLDSVKCLGGIGLVHGGQLLGSQKPSLHLLASLVITDGS